MDSDTGNATLDRWQMVEGGILLVATPLLMFPSLLPPAAVAAAAVLIATWLIQRVTIGRPLLSPSLPRKWIALFLVFVVIGTIVSVDWSYTFSKATNLLLGLGAMRYVAQLPATERWIMRVAWLYLALGAAFVLVGVFSANWVLEIDALRPVVELLPSQAVTLPESPVAGVNTNQLGSVPLLFLPLVLALLTASGTGRHRRFGLLLLLVYFGGAVILSQSRSAWVGAAASLMVLVGMASVMLPSSRRRTALRVFALIGSLVLITAVTFQAQTLLRLWQETPRESVIGTLTTINIRKEVWTWSLQAISDFPLTGVGLGAFRVVVHRLYPIATPISYDLAHAHNIFLQTALDVGIPGAVGYIGIIGSSLWTAWRGARRSDDMRALLIALFASIIGIHIYGLTDCPALGAKPWVALWAAIGLVALIARKGNLVPSVNL